MICRWCRQDHGAVPCGILRDLHEAGERAEPDGEPFAQIRAILAEHARLVPRPDGPDLARIGSLIVEHISEDERGGAVDAIALVDRDYMPRPLGADNLQFRSFLMPGGAVRVVGRDDRAEDSWIVEAPDGGKTTVSGSVLRDLTEAVGLPGKP
jgi:hypothetical protein